MSNPARSVFVFAIYLVFLGGTLLLIPNALLNLFAYPTTSEVWIRVAGMLLIMLAFYYIQAARSEMIKFFRWTVYPRSTVIFIFGGFVILGFAKPVLILFGIVDLLAALWTAIALKSSKKSNQG